MSAYSFEALGLRYVTSAVRNGGFDCLELYYEDFKRNEFAYPTEEELDRLVKLLSEKGADMVGISVRSSYMKFATIVSDYIREKLGIPVIWGSVHPTICPDDSMESADAICRGEGERAIVELLQKIEAGGDVTSVTNFWFKLPDGSVVKNDTAPYADINAINEPQYCTGDQYYYQNSVWHEGDPQMNDNSLSVMASRGCAHHCSFCSNDFYLSAQKGYLRLRSVDDLIAEIQHALRIAPHIKHVRFFDELFACNKKWADEFCRKYKAVVGIPFFCFLHPKQISDSLIEKLTSAGLIVVEMGIQHGSERFANEVYKRGVTNEKLLSAIYTLKKYGVRGNFDLITDNPLESEQDKLENLEFMLQVPRPYTLLMFSLTHLPGTQLTQMLLSKGLITEDDIEGKADHSLFQWDASLTYARSNEGRFRVALLSLVTKNFVPKGLIRFLFQSSLLKRFPAPLVAFAWVANVIKLAILASQRLREGTLTMQAIRRQINFRELTIK